MMIAGECPQCSACVREAIKCWDKGQHCPGSGSECHGERERERESGPEILILHLLSRSLHASPAQLSLAPESARDNPPGPELIISN